jgi:hypothetical protein
MIRTGLAAAIVLCALPLLNAQTIMASREGHGGSQNRARIQQKLATKGKSIVIEDYDEVIPHIVDGASWQTSITLVNLEVVNSSFDLLFFADDGSGLELDIEGIGPITGGRVNLGPFQTITLQTTGAGDTLRSGWAFLEQPGFNAIGMQAIFRQTVEGRQPQEAVVPSSNWFLRRFILPFDNTQPFITGVALANPNVDAVTVNAVIRSENGQVIETQTLTMPALGHTAFVLATAWPSTQQLRGSVEFQSLTSPRGVGGVGLRFNGSAFTSTNSFQKRTWQ